MTDDPIPEVSKPPRGPELEAALAGRECLCFVPAAKEDGHPIYAVNRFDGDYTRIYKCESCGGFRAERSRPDLSSVPTIPIRKQRCP